jgi:hypothetical protein
LHDFSLAQLQRWAKALNFSINQGSNKRETLQEILRECGFSGWYLFTARRPNPTSSKFILVNVSERRKSETAIPDEWFEIAAISAIKKLISSAISDAIHINKGNGDDATKSPSDELPRGSQLASRLGMDRRTETQTPEGRGWNSGGGEDRDGTLAYVFPHDTTRRS